jgi:hypothetical protein
MQAGQGSAATKPGNQAQKTCNAISGIVFFLFTFFFYFFVAFVVMEDIKQRKRLFYQCSRF